MAGFFVEGIMLNSCFFFCFLNSKVIFLEKNRTGIFWSG